MMVLSMPMAPMNVLGISLNPVTLAKDFALALGSAILTSLGKGASALVQALLGFVTSTSDPSFSSGWWSTSGVALFERVVAVTGSILALAFMCSIVTAVVSGDRSLLGRAFLRLPVAVIQIALVVTVTGALVAASDEIAATISRGATTGLSRFVGADLVAAITGSGIVGLICGGLLVLAALSVWAELLVRSALIYLVVLAAPLVFAAGVHPSVSGLKRRYVEGAIALIASKIVVALAFATGSAMLSGLPRSPSFGAAVGALLQALVVLGVAAFAPFILLRLVLGAEGIIAAEGLVRRPARAAMSASGVARTTSGASGLLRGLGTGGGGPGDRGGPGSGGPGTSGPPNSGPRPTNGSPTGSTGSRSTAPAPTKTDFPTSRTPSPATTSPAKAPPSPSPTPSPSGSRTPPNITAASSQPGRSSNGTTPPEPTTPSSPSTQQRRIPNVPNARKDQP